MSIIETSLKFEDLICTQNIAINTKLLIFRKMYTKISFVYIFINL